MAYFTRTNGDAQPVFALDVANGAVAASSTTTGVPTQPQGPKLEFYRLAANANCATQLGVNEFISNTLQAIQQTSTVAMYQLDTVGGVGILSVAVYPAGAFANTTVFLDQANTSGVIGGGAISWSTCTDVGFKLST